MAIETPLKFDNFSKFKFSQFHEKSLFFQGVWFPELKMECNLLPSVFELSLTTDKAANATIAVNIESHFS